MTLVELMVAMFVATALVGMLAAIVSRILLANATAREHLQTVVTIGRLGEQFRRDVHAAQSASLVEANDAPPRLKLSNDAQRTIEYEISPSGLARVAVTAGKPVARELFVLPGMKFLDCKIDEGSRHVSLSIGRLSRPQSDAATVAGQFSLVAALAQTEPASDKSPPNRN
jgi:hypothetical protein